MAALTEPERAVVYAVAYLLAWLLLALVGGWIDRRERGRRDESDAPRDTLVDALPGHEEHDDLTLPSEPDFAHAFVDETPTAPVAEDDDLPPLCPHCRAFAVRGTDGACWLCGAKPTEAA